jgi:multidrug resistance protein, MATE family
MTLATNSPTALGYHLRRTVVLALPVMLARVGLVVMLTVDTIFAGRAGGNQLAYIGISMGIQLILLAIGIGLLVGALVLTAQAQGAGRPEDCGRIWWLSLLLALVLGCIYAAIEWQGPGLLSLLRQEPDIAAGGGAALRMWAIGMPGVMLYMATSSFFEGISRPVTPMVVCIAGNLVNLALGWLLTFGAGAIAPMGASGAVLATSITLWLMFAALAIRALLLRDATALGVHSPLGGHFHLLGKILLLGLPVALSVGFETSAFSGASIIAGWIGKTPLAAYQLANNVTSFFYMLSLGLATAAAVRVGNAIGRGEPRNVARAGWAAVQLVIGVMLLVGVCLSLLRDPIAAVYTSDAEVLQAASPVLALLAVLIIFDGTQSVLMGALRGAGDVIVPTGIYAIAFGGCAVPLSYYLGYLQGRGAIGIVLGLVAGLLAAAILLGLRFAWISHRTLSAR